MGALSIVRFRTPIKETEELAYLFMAITIGIGVGAGQVPLTAFGVLVILVTLAVFGKWKTTNNSDSVQLSMRWLEGQSPFSIEGLTEKLKPLLTPL